MTRDLRSLVVPVVFGLIVAGCHSSNSIPSSIYSRASVVTVSNGESSPGEEVDSFAATATGSVTPSTDLTGAATTISDPIGMHYDSSGNLWIANFEGSSVLEFAGGATGNVAPVTTIGGGSTGLVEPCSVWIASGKVYVADYDSNTVSIWDNPSGSVTTAPAVKITSGALNNPCGIGLDPSGNIWVSNVTGSTVTEFSGSDTGSSTPIATLSNDLLNPQGLDIDRHGNIWVANSDDNDILEFAAGSPTGASPVTVITGSDVDSVVGVAVDTRGYVYAVSSGSASIPVYSPGASGAATPAQTVTISGQSNWWGIAVH